MNTKEFAKENDIVAHLIAAMDGLSRSDWSAFEGLEAGEAIVKVVWDGSRIGFQKHIPPPLMIQACTGEEPWCPLRIKAAAEKSGIFEGPVEVTIEKIEEPTANVFEDPHPGQFASVGKRRKRE